MSYEAKHAAPKEEPFRTWAEPAVQNRFTPEKKESSGLAIGAFVASLFLPLLGLIMGIVALKQDKEAGRPTGFATAAIWIGSVFTVLWVILGVVMVAAIASTPMVV